MPSCLAQLPALKSLELFCPPFSSSIASLALCTTLDELKLHFLSDEKTVTIPHIVGGFTHLNKLMIHVPGGGPRGSRSRTPLSSLPLKLFGDLTQLQALHLEIQHIKNIPKSVGDLSSLTKLKIEVRAGLMRLPEALGKLSALEDLSVTCPVLESLPKALGRLKKLKRLYVWAYYLPQLPSSLGDSQSLENLALFGCNTLTTLPDSVGNLKSLKEIHLMLCGGFETLPESLFQLTSSLQTLVLEDGDDMVPNLTPSVDTLLERFGKALVYMSNGKFIIADGKRLQDHWTWHGDEFE